MRLCLKSRSASFEGCALHWPKGPLKDKPELALLVTKWVRPVFQHHCATALLGARLGLAHIAFYTSLRMASNRRKVDLIHHSYCQLTGAELTRAVLHGGGKVQNTPAKDNKRKRNKHKRKRENTTKKQHT